MYKPATGGDYCDGEPDKKQYIRLGGNPPIDLPNRRTGGVLRNTARHTTWKGAMMTKPTGLLKTLEETEMGEISYDGKDNPLAYYRGHIPVLISAPHGTRHWYVNRWVPEEEYTSAVAMYVAQATGAHALYAANRLGYDPCYYDQSEYREVLGHMVRDEGIRLVIDLHGTGPNTPCGIALDTRWCPGCEAQVLSIFADAGWKPDNFGRLYRLYVGKDAPKVCGTHRDVQMPLVRRIKDEFGVEAVLVAANAHCLVVRRKEDATAFKYEGSFRGDPLLIMSLVAALVQLVQTVSVSEGTRR